MMWLPCNTVVFWETLVNYTLQIAQNRYTFFLAKKIWKVVHTPHVHILEHQNFRKPGDLSIVPTSERTVNKLHYRHRHMSTE